MSWWKRSKAEVKSTPLSDDIEEARMMRAEAQREILELRRQAPAVRSLTQTLMRRRQLNHFGDSLQITFTRK